MRGTSYSTGAMYLTIQNLPRQERYRTENLLLVGILPGPSEPSLIMNSYLGTIVEVKGENYACAFKSNSNLT